MRAASRTSTRSARLANPLTGRASPSAAIVEVLDMLNRETIKRDLDACDCDWCGQALQVGDVAFIDLDHGTAYCSETLSTRAMGRYALA